MKDNLTRLSVVFDKKIIFLFSRNFDGRLPSGPNAESRELAIDKIFNYALLLA